MPLSPGTMLGPYQVTARLGRGGMGEVYRARDLKLRRDVALKCLSAELMSDAERRARILSEARAAAALNHPGIATIYDIHDEHRPPFIVMELVEGETLRALAQRGALAPKVLARHLVEISDALAAAHQQGIVHGDVKPENVMVQPSGHAKLLDFGVARWVATESAVVTRTGTGSRWLADSAVAGTLAYMAPEQVQGNEVDPRADLFSLGVVCYELAAGRRPFNGPTAATLMDQIVREPPPPLGAGMPAELSRIIHKLLEKRVESRYQSAVDVRVDLSNLLRDLELGISLPAQMAGKRSVAVLPLKLMTPNPQDDYLSVALADAVINDLAARADLLVRPTSAVMRYVNRSLDPLIVGRELNVQVVVDGSIQKVGTQIRVQVQARQVGDGATLLSTKHDADTSDLFGLQDRVAESLSRALGSAPAEQPPSEPPTHDAGAYELYLRAMERISRPNQWDTRTAIAMLKQVTRMDPNFAEAWASLASACLHMGNTFEAKPQWHRQAERAMEKAIALNPENAEAHAARGRVLWSPPKGYQHRAALKALGAALRLNPRSRQALTWRGLILLHLGLYDEALESLSEALASGPDDPLALQFIAQVLWYQGRHAEAQDHEERSLSIDPVHLWAIIFYPAMTLYAGELDRAEHRIETGRQILGPDAMLTGAEALLWAKRGEFARAEQTIGHALRRQKTLLHRHHTVHSAAAVYALIGKPVEAVAQLRMAAADGLPNYPLYRDDPHFEPLRENADYQVLLEELRTDWQAYRREVGMGG